MKHKKIAEFWRKNYSPRVEKYEEFPLSNYFRKMAAIFAPGESYFYILNMNDLQLDYLSPEVTNFYKGETEDICMERLLKNADPDDIPVLERKEAVIKDFIVNFVDQEKILNYKVSYSYNLIDDYGRYRTMLMQATFISLSEGGIPRHVLSVHSDISHISPKATENVSFIDLTGSNSYFNVDTRHGEFKTLYALGPEDVPPYSKREKEIIKLLSQGMESGEIAEKLHISTNTVATHRRNILRKGKFKNTAHLVGEYFKCGFS
ncbi:response regulator transcription factor [Salinimicrobium xinjiangense]|uniref:response regulator transcription factor n=1 Tax=Salinimicrobium xinjiangense TaxID=438596 RepID=UPI000402CA1E|nr:LuxR C-terminal-related transcriptional regulator [Salinimicrobium xinjiangense]